MRNLFDIGCMAHLLNLVGENIEVKHAARLVRDIVSIMSYSHAARQFWQQMSGSTFPSFSKTRWFSFHEVAGYVAQNIKFVEQFLRECPYGDKSVLRALATLFNPQTFMVTMVELALLVDVGQNLARCCYKLNGDGPLILTAHEEWKLAVRYLQYVHACCAVVDYAI